MSKEAHQDTELTASSPMAPIIKDGCVRKKSSRVNVWGERYFALRGSTLYYYLKVTDTVPKGVMPLAASCRVTEILPDIHKKRKQFAFKVIWQLDDEKEEGKDGASTAGGKEDGETSSASSKQVKLASGGAVVAKKKQTKKKEESAESSSSASKSSAISSRNFAALAVSGVAIGAVTAGVGLLAGLVIIGIGAAAGGGAAALTTENKEYHLQLACDTYHEAEAWVFAIENQIQALGGAAGHGSKSLLGLRKGGGMQYDSNGARMYHAPPPEIRLQEVEDWVKSSRWRVSEVWECLRIMELQPGQGDGFGDDENDNVSVDSASLASSSSAEHRSNQASNTGLPCMRTTMTMNGTASHTFHTIIDMPQNCRTGCIKSLRVVETINYNSDIIHLVLHPVYVWPTWTSPRDLCLTRYWKQNANGSFVICLDSSFHVDCPLIDNHVRAELHAVYVITPLKDGDDEEEPAECSLTFIGQYDPKGWVWEAMGYQRAMLRELLFHVVDIHDCVDDNRFIPVNFDVEERGVQVGDGAGKGDSAEDDAADSAAGGSIATIPAPTLPLDMYKEPDARSFRVRGANYIEDRIKVVSAPYLFKLLCCDLFEVPGPTTNICSHPRNRVYRALQRNEDVWVFAVNIMVPGPPYLSFVAYFQGDKSQLTGDTPFGRVAQKFFFGSDDEYRNNRFKLIPKVVDGNMVVKMVVKDTPALLGNKVKVHYNKGDNYFELDIDVGSSNVARNAVRISSGYSKILVVDMGFCLQGDDPEELPEVMMGACQLVHMDLTLCKRL